MGCILSKTDRKYIFEFNTSSERPLSNLSENHKINVFGPTELKYDRSKMLYLNPPTHTHTQALLNHYVKVQGQVISQVSARNTVQLALIGCPPLREGGGVYGCPPLREGGGSMVVHH